MSNVKEFKLGELFCGPGGLALGALTARIENPEYRIVHQWANDYDASTCDTYRRNIIIKQYIVAIYIQLPHICFLGYRSPCVSRQHGIYLLPYIISWRHHRVISPIRTPRKRHFLL